MIYTPLTKRAMKIAFDVHREQVDKSGLPYVFHPFHLAEQMQDEITTVVALLHDVIEDTDYTLQMLREEGFGEDVLEALRLLTHSDDVKTEADYMAYVAKIKENPVARAVKIADLEHNADLTRLPKIKDKDIMRAAKYQKALMLLK